MLKCSFFLFFIFIAFSTLNAQRIMLSYGAKVIPLDNNFYVSQNITFLQQSQKGTFFGINSDFNTSNLNKSIISLKAGFSLFQNERVEVLKLFNLDKIKKGDFTGFQFVFVKNFVIHKKNLIFTSIGIDDNFVSNFSLGFNINY